MTGGQMAPTTLAGMRSSTTPYGRDVALMGNPAENDRTGCHAARHILCYPACCSYALACAKSLKRHA